MVNLQQGDVKLFQINDGGEISVINGIVEMSGGLETAAYLSLFGGNFEDDGRDSSLQFWWANLQEVDPARRYVSETQNLLRALPLSSANLRRIETAANRDLAWFLENDIASAVEVEATIPGVDKLKIRVEIEANGEISTFEFVENWRLTT